MGARGGNPRTPKPKLWGGSHSGGSPPHTIPPPVRPILGGPPVWVRVRVLLSARTRFRAGLGPIPFRPVPLPLQIRSPPCSAPLLVRQSAPIRPGSRGNYPVSPRTPLPPTATWVEPPSARNSTPDAVGIGRIPRKYAWKRRKSAISRPFRRKSARNTTRRANVAWQQAIPRRYRRLRAGSSSVGRPWSPWSGRAAHGRPSAQ
jgi:hypothetical protein